MIRIGGIGTMTIKEVIAQERERNKKEKEIEGKIIKSWTKKQIKKFCKEVDDTGINCGFEHYPGKLQIIVGREKYFRIYFTMPYDQAVRIAGINLSKK